jgi:hypothetical protein
MSLSTTTVPEPAVAAAAPLTIEHPFRDLRAAVAAESTYSLTLKLSVILVVMQGPESGAVEIPIAVLGGVMLIFPSLLRQPFFWWPLVACVAAANARTWFAIDNHQYLITYWLLACALSLGAPDPTRFLATSGRLLVALVFGCATFWKVFGGEYLNGSFFYWTLMTDSRVPQVTSAISGVPLDDLALMREAIGRAGLLNLTGAQIPMPDSGRVLAAALALSWLGLLLEGAIALAHVPPSRRWYALRHATLMTFIAFIYVLLPVPGFAFVLTVMGLAQCDEQDIKRRWGYLLLLIVVQLITIDWKSFLAA